MAKLILNTDGVVIGSNTLEEHKFQVLNFMNMFYDNIHTPEKDRCMNIDVVRHNLGFEISRVLKETNDLSYTNYKKSLDFIYNNIKTINEYNRTETIKKCKKEYFKLLKELKSIFNLKFEINDKG